MKEGEQVMRFNREVSIGCLDEKLATYPLDLRKSLPLDVPITNMLQKRVAVNDVYRTVGEGQVSSIGHDKRCYVGSIACITGHDIQGNDLVLDTEPGQPIFKLAIAVPNVKYSLSLTNQTC